MTLYAASSVLAVAPSKDQGGCGELHQRPTDPDTGKLVRTWALECMQCHHALKNDPLWAGAVSEIPETYDEQKVREDQEKRGIKERDVTMATALQRLALMPELLEKILTAQVPQQAALEAPLALCKEGHRNPAGARFCAECGASMAEGARGVPAPRPASRLKDMRAEDLRALAAELGVSAGGTRTELIERIRARRAAAAA